MWLCRAGQQPGTQFGFDSRGEIGVGLQELADVFLPLTEAIAPVAVPGAGLLDDVFLDAKVDQLTLPGDAERWQVKPGLTGRAQINGEYHTSPEYKRKYDLAYMYNDSVWLDLRILSDTVKIVLSRRGV